MLFLVLNDITVNDMCEFSSKYRRGGRARALPIIGFPIVSEFQMDLEFDSTRAEASTHHMCFVFLNYAHTRPEMRYTAESQKRHAG